MPRGTTFVKAKDEFMKNIEWISLNIANGVAFVLAKSVDDPIKGLAVTIGIAALAWFNIERALKTRAERKAIQQENESRTNEVKG